MISHQFYWLGLLAYVLGIAGGFYVGFIVGKDVTEKKP